MDLKNSQNKLSNLRQIGGIETSIIDNGPERGTRIAWVNTGSGLIYKLLLDRCMDIGEAYFNGIGLAWIGASGFKYLPPQERQADNWLENFGGGLLSTCGLSNIGNSEINEHGTQFLNGSINRQACELEAIVQPRFENNGRMLISSITREQQAFGYQFSLQRTIESFIGSPCIKLKDKVTNIGAYKVPHMLLYHCNFGWPLIDKDATIFWNGTAISRGLTKGDAIFNQAGCNDFRDPIAAIGTQAEACGYIEQIAEQDGYCHCGIINPNLGVKLTISFIKSQLPWLTNWQHWVHKNYVVGLEPGTNPPLGQTKAKENNQLIYLEPGEVREYEISFAVELC